MSSLPITQPFLISIFGLVFRFINTGDDDGEVPLMVAVKNTNIFMIRMLIAKGAPMTSTDRKSNSIFHFAAETNREIIEVQFLF